MSRKNNENMETERAVIVRRFTDELQATTDLEKATQKAQIREDSDAEISEQERIQRSFNSVKGTTTTDFSAAEAARKALDQICREFAKETKPGKGWLWRYRKSAETKANEQLLEGAIRDFPGLQNLVENIDQKWRTSHGAIYGNFQRVCQTLDNHSAVLKIFPSQQQYAAVLCGCLSLIVQAAVNHEAIPKFLSEVIAEISEKTARCADFVDIIREKRMQEQLAKIYARMLRFYRDAMAWYLQSRTEKLISSFNEGLKDKYVETAASIDDSINELYREGDISLRFTVDRGFYVISKNLADMRNEIYRQRQALRHEAQVGDAGLHLLKETFKDMYVQLDQRLRYIEEGKAIRRLQNQPHQHQFDTIIADAPDNASGRQFRSYARTWGSIVVGEEGPAMFKDGSFWLVDGMTMAKLETWMTEDNLSRTLWISSPYSPNNSISAARAAALSVVASAWQAGKPVISHFCKRPYSNLVTKDMTVEEAGLIGLAYSLINQLQQFVGDDERTEIPTKSLQSLDGSKMSWPKSLEILEALLGRIPKLLFCVLDGLDELEWNGGALWCQELLRVLRKHQETRSPLNLLLTTTGQSRFLANEISPKERYHTSATPREVRLPRGKIPLSPRLVALESAGDD